MHRLMLDHMRRWAWVLIVVAGAEFALGGLIAVGPEYAFEFWALVLSMWAGATLLSFDFRRGLLRPVALLPLSGRQLGRGWWLATVGLPGVVLAGLLFSGAATYCHFRPAHAFPTGRLVLGSLFTFVWLGTQFTLNFVATRGLGESWRALIGNSVIGILTSLVFFGNMLLCLNAAASPVKSALLLALGLPLTVVGWIFAVQFEPARASLYLGRLEVPMLYRGPTRRVRGNGGQQGRNSVCGVPTGPGAMQFLLRTLWVRAFFQIGFMVALMVLAFQLLDQGISPSANSDLWAPMVSFMPAWFIVFYQFMPVLQHLRLLGTMPISAGKLAAALLALALVPLSSLGALVSVIVWPMWGASAALAYSNCFVFAIGGAAVCAFLAVWRGLGMQGYALILLSLLGFLMAHLWLQGQFRYLERPFVLAGPIALAFVLLAFVLTRQVLMHSCHSYRVKADPFGEFPMARNS